MVSTSQLREVGIGRNATTKRIQAGGLHPLHRGVYSVGHTNLSFEGRCMAALLALGAGAVVSHVSAAALWGMLKPPSGPIHLTLPGDGGRKRRRDITIHRSSTLSADFLTRPYGIAVTKPKRTLRDLHRASPQSVFTRAVRRALDLRLIDSSDLRSEDDLTRSELERILLALCRRHRLPKPEVNARAGPYEVDFLWCDRGVIVETDGFRHHAPVPPSSVTAPEMPGFRAWASGSFASPIDN